MPDDNDRPTDPLEFLLGKIPEGSFEVLAGEVLKRRVEISANQLAERSRILLGHGISLDPALTPTHWSVDQFTAEDWDQISRSTTPLLTLYSANNYHGLVAQTEYAPLGYGSRRDPRAGYTGQRDRALLRSLSLIHGTSADTFAVAAESGEILSYRELRRRHGTAPTAGGNHPGTTFEDRQVGLDQYVFADFGRPHPYRRGAGQSQVTLVIDPAAMMLQPGAFATEEDYLDCVNYGEGDLYDLRQYLSTVLTPEYFYEAALLRISLTKVASHEMTVGRGVYQNVTEYNNAQAFAAGVDSERSPFAATSFSTWEVKLPSVPMTAVQRVIVRDTDAFDLLQRRFGERFDFAHAPNLEASTWSGVRGNYNVLKVPGAFEVKFREGAEADHRRRAAELAALPPEAKEAVVVLFPGTDSDTQDPMKAVGVHTDPYLHPNQDVCVYQSMDALRADVMAPYDTQTSPSMTASGNPLWFADDPMTGRPAPQNGVIATAERAKANPRLIRVTGLRAYDLGEFLDRGNSPGPERPPSISLGPAPAPGTTRRPGSPRERARELPLPGQPDRRGPRL